MTLEQLDLELRKLLMRALDAGHSVDDIANVIEHRFRV